MSARPLITPHSVITNGNMSGNITSSVSIINQISMFSYALSWAGTSPVGVVTVQVSNDYRAATGAQPAVAGTWSTLTLDTPGAVSGNTGTGFIDIDQCGAYAVRLVYTSTSGTGILNASIAGKVA